MRDTEDNSLINEEQDSAVESQEVQNDVADEDKFPESEGAPEEENEQTPAKSVQSKEDNRAFAEMRRAKEASERRAREQEEELNRIREDNRRLLEAVSAYGYEGEAQDIAAQLLAAQNKTTADNVKNGWKRENEEYEKRIENDPRVLRAKQYDEKIRIEQAKNMDLLAIKNAFPTERATRLEDIANIDKFIEYRSKGIPAEESYELANRHSTPTRRMDDKSHLTPADGGAGDSKMVNIPKDELAVWRDAFPDESLKQLTARYNRARNR